MATSVRDLKKELKYAFEELIEQVLLLQVAAGGNDKKNNALINEMVDAYEALLKKVNAHKKADNKKAYFKELNKEIDAKIKEFQEKINVL
jgi:hypothetical protein